MIATWWVKPLVFTALIIVIGLIGTAIQRLLAKKTVANWMGTGVNEELAPHEAALLLAMHPSAIIMVLFAELERANRVKLLGDHTIRAAWIGGGAADRVERASAEALDENGEFGQQGVFRLLEEIYERTDTDLIGFSGRATAVHYREYSQALFEGLLEKGTCDPGLLPWLLLARPDDRWEQIGDGPSEEAFKRAYYLMNLAVHRLVPAETYVSAVDEARHGFFRYRKDLRTLTRSVAAASAPRWWTSIEVYSESDSE